MGGGAPDYYKSILLYGLYNGVPVPLACDEQGRLVLVMEEVSPFDKAGTILLRDDFGNGLVHVVATGVGEDWAVAVDSTEAMVGGYSCKMTGGSDSLRQALVTYYCPLSAFNKVGLEFAVRWGEEVEKLQVYANFYDGTYWHQGKVRYLPSSDEWQAYDWTTSAWVAILSDVAYLETAHVFYPFKLVLDLENDVYHTFKYPGGSVDLSAYSLYKIASTTPPRVEAHFLVTSNEGLNAHVHLDNVIFTQDES